MRRIRVLGVILGLMLLLSMFAFITPAGASTGGGDIDNFGYGILTDNLTMNGAFSGTMGICGTNSVTTNGAFSHNGGILSGGPITLKGSFIENGNIISVGNIAISGSPIINGNLESKGSISSGGIVQGVRTPYMTNLPVSIPSSLPQPDWDYYSPNGQHTCNPTVLSPSNGNISNVISQIHGGTYYINGDVTWDTAISSFNTATTIVANGNITITSGITMGNNGGLALIARKGITVKGANIFNNVLLWAGGYDGASNVTFNGASIFTGDIVSKNGITINGAMTFYQEQTIPVAPPLKPAPPTVTGINPNSGPTAGGTTVTITGTNFTGATAVAFGSVPATSFTVNSDTQITATSPAGFGTVDVRVTTPGGTSATSAADQFTYVARLSLTGASLPDGNYTIPYITKEITNYVTASGGTGTGYVYSVDNLNSLPGNFSFNNNVLSTDLHGPNAYGTFSVTVRVTDSGGNTDTCQLPLIIHEILPSIGAIESPANNGTIYGTYTVKGWYLVDQTCKSVDRITISVVNNDDGSTVLTDTAHYGDSRSDISGNPDSTKCLYPDYHNPNAGFDYKFDTTNLANGGEYTLSVKVTEKITDDLGNVSYKTNEPMMHVFHVYQPFIR